ncbi:unnamed protein product [Prorocentrum cordatum]|uniref:S1 motif domain-containing protein n=3 Tax=Prorocentrum cordatum TaxID=2364126 RepID=A0ABN9YDC9_9DINO|nr:unnamed protein product [Polarella glacialis]
MPPRRQARGAVGAAGAWARLAELLVLAALAAGVRQPRRGAAAAGWPPTTLRELREELRRRDLSWLGQKSQLVRRLELADASLPIGRKLKAVVSAVDSRGMKVDIDVGAQASAAAQRLSRLRGLASARWLADAFAPGVERCLQPGDVVDAWPTGEPEDVKLLHGGPKQRQQRFFCLPVAVSPKRPAENLSAVGQLEAGAWLGGRVTAVMSFGVFAEVALPEGGLARWGFIRPGDLDRGAFGKEVQIGDELRVRVVKEEAHTGRLWLSMLPLGAMGAEREEAGEQAPRPGGLGGQGRLEGALPELPVPALL